MVQFSSKQHHFNLAFLLFKYFCMECNLAACNIIFMLFLQILLFGICLCIVSFVITTKASRLRGGKWLNSSFSHHLSIDVAKLKLGLQYCIFKDLPRAVLFSKIIWLFTSAILGGNCTSSNICRKGIGY